MTRQRELGRGERVLPGLWRLRLPLPWPEVPHCNAWAIAAGSGIVLIDTGMHLPGSLSQLERALAQVSLRLEHVRLLACTHAHSDHWGEAAPIRERAGCELWMHPKHEHAVRAVEDPELALARRIEVGRQSGVPEEALRRSQSGSSCTRSTSSTSSTRGSRCGVTASRSSTSTVTSRGTASSYANGSLRSWRR